MTSSADTVETQLPTTVRVFRQRFSSTRRGARLARLLTVEQLSSWGIKYGSDLSASAALIVADLAANAVTHGRVPGRDFEVRLTLALDSGVLRIGVSDARGERLPRAAAPVDGEASGHGLVLVATLASQWGVEPRRSLGKTVWADVRLP
ncbi:ATP-binding protein [Streptomyces sp. PSKA54]|uniref:ATP-binding protein n=1 Tax=Streptomyces himalayensis subsp. aureolus TaxID=2758039 RepID=A0A7W2D6L8_9ACTN|nr:ATP-binding protein [Streptomyces himalayensis]MBA4865616.1 ATP-binding protein [Streptomyces himalayensis subsp. aureolus]